QRRGVNKAAVAMAHRMARLMWILLQKNEYYRPIRSCNQVQGNA
ncbi:IS110 family transposase, partial [Pseudoalteromonas citrea]